MNLALEMSDNLIYKTPRFQVENLREYVKLQSIRTYVYGIRTYCYGTPYERTVFDRGRWLTRG